MGIVRTLVCVAIELSGERPITKGACEGASGYGKMGTEVSSEHVFVCKCSFALSAVEGTRYRLDWSDEKIGRGNSFERGIERRVDSVIDGLGNEYYRGTGRFQVVSAGVGCEGVYRGKGAGAMCAFEWLRGRHHLVTT